MFIYLQAFRLNVLRNNNDKIDEIWIDMNLGALYFKYMNTMSELTEKVEISRLVGIKNYFGYKKEMLIKQKIYYPVIIKNDVVMNDKRLDTMRKMAQRFQKNHDDIDRIVKDTI
jgi:hypothetical protein